MAGNMKSEASTSDFEVDSQDLHLQSKVRSLRRVDGARIGVTILALVMGITILGLSGDALYSYNTTHVSQNFYLPLWPDNFDLRPTVALVVGAAIVTLTNVVSLVCSKVPSLRYKTTMHTSLTFVAPFIGLVAALIAMIFFYAVNASETVDTLLSWTCRWQALSMTQRPQFGNLCKESWAGVYMSILLIPIEAVVLAIAGYQMKIERYTSAYSTARKSSSPVMS